MVETNSLVPLFCQTAAADLRLLADLNAVELSEERAKELVAMQFPDCLGLDLNQHDATLVLQQLRDLLGPWQTTLSSQELDAMASDFASIYLNGSLHSHPSESVWLDDEELTCQQPMFEVRAWYEKHGLAVPNWRVMSDDHLVNELLFVAHLLDKVATAADAEQAAEANNVLLQETAQFMDEHLLRWLLPFGQRVAQRCQTPFYAGIAVLTALYAEQVRDWLADILQQPRLSHEEIEAQLKAKKNAPAVAQPVRYFPGTAPSW